MRAQAEIGSFHEEPRPCHAATVDHPANDGPGTAIGPYKLLEQIGEGGMGEVWVAEQVEPVKRRVAIKLIKAGMDSRAVLARFEAERQALALMDHPNIAKVLDAGTPSPAREPSGARGLLRSALLRHGAVKGTPITWFRDESSHWRTARTLSRSASDPAPTRRDHSPTSSRVTSAIA